MNSGFSKILKKGIAAHALGIVLILLAFLFFIGLLVFYWLGVQNVQTTKSTCFAKLISFCTDWWKKDFKEIPYSWSEKSPENCEQEGINIKQPMNSDDCKALLRVS